MFCSVQLVHSTSASARAPRSPTLLPDILDNPPKGLNSYGMNTGKKDSLTIDL